MEQKDFSLRDFILSRSQQMVVGILLSGAILASSILILRRVKEERQFANIKVVHSESQFPIPNFQFPISNLQSSIPNPKPQTLTATSIKKPQIININKANKNELIKLPGIGPKLADRIIKYRKENGTFTSIEDIIKVKGIGLKKFEKCKNMIRVD